MNRKSVLVVGGTGAVGRELVARLASLDSVDRITAVVRRPLWSHLRSSKVNQHEMDMDHLEEASDCFAVNAVFCALGTTRKIAGSEANFRRIDHDMPLEIAKLAKSRGARHFLIVSAIGANPRSRIFYNRIKGEIERDLAELEFPYLTIVRPSVMIRKVGNRRPLEEVTAKIANFLPPKWRSVSTGAVADSMIRSLVDPVAGIEIVENCQIVRNNPSQNPGNAQSMDSHSAPAPPPA